MLRTRVTVPLSLSFRPEYTSQGNIGAGRHDWLRLIPAYSVELVEELLADYPTTAIVCDPFGGTGTTALCASTRGNPSVSNDINPFLVWLARAKVAKYSRSEIQEAIRIGIRIGEKVGNPSNAMADSPPISNLERWWGKRQLQYLRLIKGAIDRQRCSTHTSDLLKVAFCRTLMTTANVTRGHPSLTFSENRQLSFFDIDVFGNALTSIVESAGVNPKGKAKVLLGDARELSQIKSSSVDVVITSPPYPNRVTTIRELRPYMYWLDFFRNSSEPGALDWRSIGGTWGMATSRLRSWKPDPRAFVPHVVKSVGDRIQMEENGSAQLMANYVRRYFEDMRVHFGEVRRILRHKGTLHYVVGNSSFYGHTVEVEKAYVDILRNLGFSSPKAATLRKRTSKHELYEYLISATKP